jgi:hypothetical protein
LVFFALQGLNEWGALGFAMGKTMTSGVLRIEHIAQPAVLVDDLDDALDWIAQCFKAYPSERVDIAGAGVNNAVYAFANRTYLELIEPYNPESSAYRLLGRAGPGWHMLNVDIVDAEPDDIEGALTRAGTRVVQRNKTAHVRGAWHLHPGDTDGVLMNLANPTDHDEHGMWAGWAWREYVTTNTRVVHDILGVSLVTDDLHRTQRRYAQFGCEFGDPFMDAADEVVQAICPAGSFLQIRAPRASDSPGAELLAARGPGLYHLCWGTKDLEHARKALAASGAALLREEKGAVWTDARSTGIKVTMEFREHRPATLPKG